jgi:H+/Cl- antiporter ClcA
MSFPNPLGVFSPTMVLGALFGRLIGEAMNLMFPGGTLPAPHPMLPPPATHPFKSVSALALHEMIPGPSRSMLRTVFQISHFCVFQRW